MCQNFREKRRYGLLAVLHGDFNHFTSGCDRPTSVTVAGSCRCGWKIDLWCYTALCAQGESWNSFMKLCQEVTCYKFLVSETHLAILRGADTHAVGGYKWTICLETDPQKCTYTRLWERRGIMRCRVDIWFVSVPFSQREGDRLYILWMTVWYTVRLSTVQD